MFNRSKSNDTPPPSVDLLEPETPAEPPGPALVMPKAAPSVLSADLKITGNIKTPGDIQVEGNVEGDIRAAHLTVGATATIKGEVVAEEVVVNGRVIGRLRGLKIRLTGTARVEGDIIHKTIAIENGAHFEGSVQRRDDPLAQDSPARLPVPPAKDAAREALRTPQAVG